MGIEMDTGTSDIRPNRFFLRGLDISQLRFLVFRFLVG
jgi:hypothetical protein